MLIQPNKSCLLVIDLQEKLLPAIHEGEAVVENTRWLAEIANHLEIPVLTSEQYPQGLGGTAEALLDVLPKDGFMEKMSFSCMSDPGCNEKINAIRPGQVVVAGTESHVCVLQTCLQLKQQAREVYVVEDCVSSRNPKDKELALERMRQAGIYIVSREMVVFEWLQTAKNEQFRHISKNYLR